MGYVLALDGGLLTDPAERKKAGDRLAALIRSKAGEKNTGMTTGFLGTKPLLPVLTDTGHLDLAVSMIQSRKYPSWGYEVKNGATTIWERWNSYTEEHGFGGSDGKMNAAMNSFSHYAFGAVTEWMFTDLAGIAPAELTLPKTSPWGGTAATPVIHQLAPGSHRFEISK